MGKSRGWSEKGVSVLGVVLVLALVAAAVAGFLVVRGSRSRDAGKKAREGYERSKDLAGEGLKKGAEAAKEGLEKTREAAKDFKKGWEEGGKK